MYVLYARVSKEEQMPFDKAPKYYQHTKTCSCCKNVKKTTTPKVMDWSFSVRPLHCQPCWVQIEDHLETKAANVTNNRTNTYCGNQLRTFVIILATIYSGGQWWTYLSSSTLMNPNRSLSNTRKASRISSSESVLPIFLAIILRNSAKSTVPLPMKIFQNSKLGGTGAGCVPCFFDCLLLRSTSSNLSTTKHGTIYVPIYNLRLL